MEKIEFKETTEIKDFTKRCLKNCSLFDYKGSIEIIENYWENAKNIDDFKKLVFNDERLINNQGYWELAKEENEEKYLKMVRDYLSKIANETFITESDIGSLKIGNEDFAYNIGNLYGDGENYVYIFDKNIDLNCVKFLASIEGKEINVYDYDCGKNSIKVLNGRYGVYREKQIFVFVKWE